MVLKNTRLERGFHPSLFLGNLMYDGLLNIVIPSGGRLVRYVDVIDLIISKQRIVESDRLSRIIRWLHKCKLKLAVEKSVATLVNRKVFQVPKIGVVILNSGTVKLDTKLTFTKHIKKVWINHGQLRPPCAKLCQTWTKQSRLAYI